MKKHALSTACRAALALALLAPAAPLAGFAAPAQDGSTRTEIRASELPTAVRQAIARQYPGYHVDDARKSSGGKNGPTYRVELEGRGKKELHVTFSAAGQVLRSRADDQGDDRDDD